MKKQMTKITMILVFAIGLTAGAASAQDKVPMGIYTGMQTANGKCDLVLAACSGNMFVMNSSNKQETRVLVLYLDYSLNSFLPNNYIVTGGSWSLGGVRDDRYSGTLHGEILGGAISINQNDQGESESKNVQLNLVSVSGFGIFDGKAGVDISGVYFGTTNMKTKETNGAASFDF